MKTIVVQDSLRKKKRELKNALGDDILRYIAELITNSDDSYRRLEAKGLNNDENENVIYIELLDNANTGEYILSITDNAEGMDTKTVEKIFGVYGGDNAGGDELHARVIFGQGASDVLRASASESKIACIETIKNDTVTKLTYHMNEDLTSSINIEKLNLKSKELEEFRIKNRIPKNGTKVTFGIPSTVKFTRKIRESLPLLISQYPSFRYLLNDKKRKVLYVEGMLKIPITSENYQFLDENLLAKKNFNLKFEGSVYKCTLKMYKNDKKSEDGTEIIVRDENYNVFDNTMFDFQNSASAGNISGELLITGLYSLCYEHLNSEYPDAIVRDNRTGFDTKNDFYIALNKTIAPILEKILNEHGKNIKTTDLTNNKKFNEALKKLNRYMASEIKDEISGGNIEGIDLPDNGLKFIRNMVSITKGRTYNLKLLINSNLINPNQTIEIIMDKNKYIELTSESIKYDIEDVHSGLVIKNISIKGLEVTKKSINITAKCGVYTDTVDVSVIEDTIHYPENGFEFYPNSLSQSPSTEHNLKLYIDSKIIPSGSVVTINTGGLEIEDDTYVFREDNLINDTIGIMNIALFGGELDKIYDIEATCNDFKTNASIAIIEPTRNEPIGGGLIAGFKLEPSTSPLQAHYNSHTHLIIINTLNPINVLIMGDMKDKDPENPTFTKEQSKYLCDIISREAAIILVKEQIKNEEININSFDDVTEELERIIQEHKNNIFQELYSSIISQLTS